MKLCVIGAGATGGYFGAIAARGGADVTFVARGAHGEAMRTRGVRVVGPHDEFTVAPWVVADVSEAGTAFDVVLVTVKTFDLAAVLPAARAAIGDGGVLVTAQNGIDAEDQAIAAGIPASRLAGAVLVIGVGVEQPGVLRHHGMAHVYVGAPRPESASAARRAVDELSGAGVPASLHPDFVVARWSKLVWNNAFNAITALVRLPVATTARDPALRELATRAMREVESVARAEGIKLPADIIETCLVQANLVGEVKTSMLQDVENGRRLEHDALIGAVTRRAQEHGIATPVNDTLLALLGSYSSQASR